jgi:hypothetical protein
VVWAEVAECEKVGRAFRAIALDELVAIGIVGFAKSAGNL